VVVGGWVVGGWVVGGWVVGGLDVGGWVVGGEVDCVTGDVDVVPGVLEPPPVAGEDVVGAAADADDLPLDSTANQSLSTPWPPAWPFFLSLTNV
jgi:hypothetical protein